jgi:Schlafen, AlbA_2
MSLEQTPFDSIAEDDLQDLVTQRRVEQKTLEYKLLLKIGSDGDKKEFLGDVSSFANAAGGYLLYGIKEVDGAPTDIPGLELANPDETVRTVDNIIRDGLQPRLTPIATTRAVPLKSGRFALVIHVPRSWNAPHMVIYKYKESPRFLSRTSNGKYPFDVGEIRTAFLRSEAVADRIRNFRADRIARIVAGEFPTPAPLADAPKLVLHVVPLGAFDAGANVDVSRGTEDTALQGLLKPLGELSLTQRFNLDGYLTFSRHRDLENRLQPPRAYAQLFRNGCIESVGAAMLSLSERDRRIPSVAFEKYTLESLADYLKALERLGAEPPYFVMLSLIGVAGYEMAVGQGLFAGEGSPIDRDVLVIPEALIETHDAKLSQAMKPSFDAVWNAAG